MLIGVYLLLMFLLLNSLGFIALGIIIFVLVRLKRTKRNLKSLRPQELALLGVALALLLGQHFVRIYFSPFSGATEYSTEFVDYDIYIPRKTIKGSKEVSRVLRNEGAAFVSEYSKGPIWILYEQGLDTYGTYLPFQTYECSRIDGTFSPGCKRIGTAQGYPVYVDAERHKPGKEHYDYNALVATEATFIGINLMEYVSSQDIVEFFTSLEKRPVSKVEFFSKKNNFYLFP